jgi:hypothetical protein
MRADNPAQSKACTGAQQLGDGRIVDCEKESARVCVRLDEPRSVSVREPPLCKQGFLNLQAVRPAEFPGWGKSARLGNNAQSRQARRRTPQPLQGTKAGGRANPQVLWMCMEAT